MKYKISLNDEDYLLFNIFYATHSTAGKRSLNTARMILPVLAIVSVLIFFIAGAEPGLILTEAVLLFVLSAAWCVYVPKIIEKNIRKNITKMKSDGKLPFHAESEIEFTDSMITEQSEQGEIHVNYNDIENIYIENGYLYIFYSAVQAFIIPFRCLGKEKEQVTEYVKKAASCHH